MFTRNELIYIKESLKDELRSVKIWCQKYDYNNSAYEKTFQDYENLIKKVEKLLDNQN